ncbi:MAG TPA: hypothetical protein VMZ53_15855 [Kofleriaceae bacterium]|nr:hypothetical protein [Kofleriaceae bacterium]
MSFSARLLVVGGALAATTFLDSTAHADRRMFTSTYEYKTVPEGHTALELWHTESRQTWDNTTPQALEHILEIEHGLTDHWDLAFYTVFDQTAGGTVAGVATESEPFHLAEMKLETRYRFADRGELPVDILAYGELVKVFGESIYEVEAKGIFARDFDKVTVALNVIAEIMLGKNAPETEPEFGWALGASYEVHPKVNVGVETYGEIEEEEVGASIGPALAIAPSGNFWFTFTAAFGLTDEAPALSGRLIVGVEL